MNEYEYDYYDDWNIFEEHARIIQRTKEYLTKNFADLPLVAMLYMDRTVKLYGPFKDGEEASKWCETIPHGVHLVWQPLRNPYIKRESNDFYLPERMENMDKEFDHTIREMANDISITS